MLAFWLMIENRSKFIGTKVSFDFDLFFIAIRSSKLRKILLPSDAWKRPKHRFEVVYVDLCWHIFPRNDFLCRIQQIFYEFPFLEKDDFIDFPRTYFTSPEKSFRKHSWCFTHSSPNLANIKSFKSTIFNFRYLGDICGDVCWKLGNVYSVLSLWKILWMTFKFIKSFPGIVLSSGL